MGCSLGSRDLCERLMRGAHHRLSIDVELLVDVSDLPGRAERVHPDETAFQADVAFPPQFDRSFHIHARSGATENALLVGGVLLFEEEATRHGDDGGWDPLLLKQLA